MTRRHRSPVAGRHPARPSILFVNQHYWPDVASTGQHLTDLAEHLAASGFDIRVVTGRGGYRGGALDAPEQEIRHGVRIRRVELPGFGRRHDSQAGRAADYAAFHVRALAAALLDERPDLVVSLTTPSLLSVTIRAVCGMRGIPYGIWAMDLHPEIEERLGLLPGGGALAAPLRAASRWGYRGADFVVALGPFMARRIREGKGVDPDRIHEIPVWSDGDEVRPVPHEENALRNELGLEGAFVVVYSGNAGLAHRFGEVYEAMRRLDGEEDVEFVFVGAGPRRAEIEGFVREQGLTNFRYLEYFPRVRLHESLSMADVHLVTLRAEMAGLAAPGKLQGILAAGRPVLMVGPEASEPGAILLEAGVGSLVEPDGDVAGGGERLAERILDLRDRPEHCRRLGERAREAFLERFEKGVGCRRWESHLRARIGSVEEGA